MLPIQHNDGAAKAMRHMASKWTAEQDEVLRENWGHVDVHVLAASFGLTAGQVRWRAAVLKFDLGTLPAERLPHDEDADIAPSKESCMQDDNFIAAMTAAIVAGKERAPIGIDRRPCTKNPRFIPHGPPALRGGSPAAACADLGK